jgi:hypothetical protein
MQVLMPAATLAHVHVTVRLRGNPDGNVLEAFDPST